MKTKRSLPGPGPTTAKAKSVHWPHTKQPFATVQGISGHGGGGLSATSCEPANCGPGEEEREGGREWGGGFQGRQRPARLPDRQEAREFEAAGPKPDPAGPTPDSCGPGPG